MHKTLRRSFATGTVAALAMLGTATSASAQGAPATNLGPPIGPSGAPGRGRAVFVQTDNPTGNAIDVFSEHHDGRLSLRQVAPTGGLGGKATSSVVDHLASQSSLVYDPTSRLLFAVNAGSNTLSVLSTRGRQLRLLQVISSGGAFPDSVAVHGRLVYVLDAGGSGTVTGYRVVRQRLIPLPGSARSLGLSNTTPPFFLDSPGQVGFSADGSKLIVTTKASTDSLDLFAVNGLGWLSATPTVTADPGNVPFAFAESPSGQLVVAEPGPSAVHTYGFSAAGALTSLSGSVPDGQKAACWITEARGYYYVANAGSNDVSAYTVSPNGTPALVGSTGVAATTDAGSIDLAASSNGRNLYVEAGAAGAVDEFHVNADGSLSDLGSVAGLGAGIEGIATS